jgi:hypothetical protein
MRTMVRGAQTLEELETLLEDALVLADGEAVAHLFAADGVFVAGASQAEARGHDAITRVAERIAAPAAGSYLAQPRRILQSRDIALLLGDGVINVARRGPDRTWRFVISLLDADLVPRRNAVAQLPQWASPPQPPHP